MRPRPSGAARTPRTGLAARRDAGKAALDAAIRALNRRATEPAPAGSAGNSGPFLEARKALNDRRQSPFLL